MNPSRLLNLTGTITAVTYDGATDAYGNPTETTTTSTVRCWIQQSTSTDEAGASTLETDEFDFWAEPAAILTANDRVEVLGETYEVVGPPWQAINPRTTRLEYVQAKLKRSSR